jgi:type I restriction enzyme S subunit
MSTATVRLGDVATFVRGITFKPADVLNEVTADAVGCMRTKNVQTQLDETDVWFLSKNFVANKNQVLQEGDLLVSTANSWNLVGKACWVPKLNYECTFGGFISALRATDALVDRRYLYYWFTSKKIQAKLRSFGNKTTNISNLSIKRANDLVIPLPPLPQQQRIAAILDKASEIKAKREQAIAKLDELAQSTFVEMFGEQLSSSTTTVNDFFQVNVNRYETNLKDTDNVAFVPMSAVSEISKSIENEETKTYSDVRKGYTPIKRGDLIVAKITPCYENGKQAIATVSTQFAYGSTEFHTFRSSNKDLVTLLHYYLQTKKVMREGAANMKGAAGQRRVPDSFFKSLPFSLPATNELSKFGAVIASQNKRRAEQIRQLAVIENTIQSLQHQAFTTGFTA